VGIFEDRKQAPHRDGDVFASTSVTGYLPMIVQPVTEFTDQRRLRDIRQRFSG
jgi:hypothetical protein